MVLPGLKLEWVSDQKGYGLFATQKIPKGTITFVQDPLDIVLTANQVKDIDEKFHRFIDTYSYRDFEGNHIISWDFGKYMNHCCHANTLSTGFGFEIAVRDIMPGEEVTDDYRLFCESHKLEISCGQANCQMKLSYDSLRDHFPMWDEKIQSALGEVKKVEQPLIKFLTPEVSDNLQNYLDGEYPYPGVGDFCQRRKMIEAILNPANPWHFMVEDLAKNYYWICDNFISATESQNLLTYAEKLKEQGKLVPAKVGKGQAHRLDEEIRGDQTYWINDWQIPELEKVYASYLKISEIARCQLFLPVRSITGHFAYYPPGRGYASHVDTLSVHSNRLLSVVLYLSDLEVFEGGALVIYDEQARPISIQPRQGRLVIFDSSLEHEVTKTTKERWSLTSWLSRQNVS